ncbi:LysR family transcriptional regulator [Azotobacter vinelandii CA]|uniref:LysR family transcriptional regulator n=2 Tax=Azotobacter vinelandii TaxID=354 RepID=C1DN82_AZOVD|nr:LysR substrate-binding domain-containing protein [Azotobacter vinelandii]ACO79249.1 LysR family transcriptional regulator [Azotobacter vinelandii DJ]AGK14761.1 LysR family transcriptional regulator [Azotobacter vinelandii CA]AGK21059.1 LysR family transcriptional regulator [Azotobacter vinelandii CA6]WKN20213.1 LysR substrate-binding domain-containing protein [Azotobacter vinelandii]SFY28009.1 DNA-binding transcriptional regulator, LysR family [Azotobacter vinelandii]
MDLRHLKYFIAVAEEKNIGRAAVRLHISQPPLTRQIQQLEDELGVRLFIRTPRGVELTSTGELFLEEARNIHSLIEQATERTQLAGRGKLGRLDIATFGSGILDTIPKLLLAFRKNYPDVKVVLHTMNKNEQIEALLQRRISLGFNRLLTPTPGIASELVTNESLLLAINKNDPLSKASEVSLQSLADHPFILFPTGSRPSFIDKTVGLCQQAGFTPQVSQEVEDVVTAISLVASGFGICLVSETTSVLAFPGVVYRPLAHLPENAHIDLSCIFRADDGSPLLAAFLNEIRNFRESPGKRYP